MAGGLEQAHYCRGARKSQARGMFDSDAARARRHGPGFGFGLAYWRLNAEPGDCSIGERRRAQSRRSAPNARSRRRAARFRSCPLCRASGRTAHGRSPAPNPCPALLARAHDVIQKRARFVKRTTLRGFAGSTTLHFCKRVRELLRVADHGPRSADLLATFPFGARECAEREASRPGRRRARASAESRRAELPVIGPALPASRPTLGVSGAGSTGAR